MTKQQKAISTDEIQHRAFFAVAAVIQLVTARALEDNANPQQIESPQSCGLIS